MASSTPGDSDRRIFGPNGAVWEPFAVFWRLCMLSGKNSRPRASETDPSTPAVSDPPAIDPNGALWTPFMVKLVFPVQHWGFGWQQAETVDGNKYETLSSFFELRPSQC